MSENNNSPSDEWSGLHGQSIELALLQIDIVDHSGIVATNTDKLSIKVTFAEAIKRIAVAHRGKLFSWGGDGGSFMFLTGGNGFNELVNAALEMLEGMPELNKKIIRDTGLKKPLQVRLSCHAGIATYRDSPGEISGNFINLFLKHERSVGSPDTVCITEAVHQQLNAMLQDRFRWKKRSVEMGCAIYELQTLPKLERAGQKRLTQFPGWIFCITPLLALGIALLPFMHPILVAGEVLVVILVNGFLSWRKSKSESTEDQDLLRSLILDEILAPKSGRPLVFQARIVIVEDVAQKSDFFRSIEHAFKSADESKYSNLILIPFTCPDGATEADERTLRLTLEGANAVVVVWTKALREKSWVYKTIDNWAFQGSDVPILFALADRSIPEPAQYLHIPVDSKSLPWRLLQRGNERARDWRTVAGFNRIMVLNILVVLLMVVTMAAILIERHRMSTQRATADLFDGVATALKEQFLATSVVKNIDPNTPLHLEDFNVSLWFITCGEARQFASTEDSQEYLTFDLNNQSVIGNAFSHGTYLVEGRPNEQMKIWDIHEVPRDDSGAKMHEEQNKDRRIVTCATHTSDPPVRTSAVGICVFSNRNDVTLDPNKFHQALRSKAIELYTRASPYLAVGEINSLPGKADLMTRLKSLYRCTIY
jgi:hypothetical protein